MSVPSESAERRWVTRWKEASPELEQVRRQELRRMTESQALAAAENLLSLAGAVKPGSPRWLSSGLVEQQALFHRLRRA